MRKQNGISCRMTFRLSCAFKNLKRGAYWYGMRCKQFNFSTDDAANLATTLHASPDATKVVLEIWTSGDVVKKLRLRVIAGPSEVVCGRLTAAKTATDPCALCVHLPSHRCRILRYDTKFGKCYSGLMTSAKIFLGYVARGTCEVREKISNDTFQCVAILLIVEFPLTPPSIETFV